MRNRNIFTFLALSLLAAAPRPDPEELVRQGNAAFEREDYVAAVAAYTEAEERITDPGLVAFNKGAALFRLERYAEAAAHYRRCLEDATGAARAAMLYNLGNCLLHESRGHNVERLQQAIAAFGQCLRQTGLTDDIRDNARHNLELAKLLWLKAKQARPNREHGNNPDKTEDPPPPKPEPKTPDEPNPGDAGPKPSGDLASTGQPTTDPGPNPTPTPAPPPPGSGNLPPVPDQDELTRMLPEDAAMHLQRAAERVLRERRDHLKRMAPAASRVLPDW